MTFVLVCAYSHTVVVYLFMYRTSVYVNKQSVYCKQDSVKFSVCPSLHSRDPSSAPRPPCWSCLTSLSSMWPPTGTTLVLSFKDHLLEESRPPREVRWRPAAVTCSSAGSEGRGHRREEWSWSTLLGQCRAASERSQLGALPLTAGSTVSVLCPVWSPQQEKVWGIDWSYCCLYIRCLSLLLMTPHPTLMTCPLP